MLVLLPADEPTVAEAVMLARPFAGSGVGFVVGPRLVARAGVAAVSALRAHGPVMADVRLGGDEAAVATAARTLATGGASRVTIGPGCAPSVVRRVAELLEPFGTRTVVTIIPPELDDVAAEALTVGIGRGRTISRVAALLAGMEGVEVLGITRDVGVVAQAAPGVDVVVTGVVDPDGVSVARDRGATAVVLSTEIAASDPSRLAPFLDAAA